MLDGRINQRIKISKVHKKLITCLINLHVIANMINRVSQTQKNKKKIFKFKPINFFLIFKYWI